MKKQFFKIAGVGVALWLTSIAGSYGQNQNFIRTVVPKVPVSDLPALQSLSADKSKVQTSTVYFDGLGRPQQSVQRQASPSGNDVVTPVAYDAYGREVKKYLPYAAPGATDGEYKADALNSGAGLQSFYNPANSSGGQLQGGLPRITTPYAETVLEASPLSRPIEQGAPGEPWQPSSSGIAGSGHVVKTNYGSNANNEVKLWQNNGSGASWGGNNYYTAGQLYKTTVWDENQHYAIEYKDKQGRVVCKKVQGASGAELETYYVYDDYGNLVYVVPPLPASVAYPQSFTESDAVFAAYMYAYHHDHRNRITEKKLPGKGWEFMVYNRLDQVTFTQDAGQRSKSNQEWTFSRYDNLGRVVMTGIWYSGDGAENSLTAPSRSRLQWLTAWSDAHAPVWATPNPATATGYNNDDPPGEILTINYYDRYEFAGSNPYAATQSTSNQYFGLATGSQRKILNADGTYGAMLWSVMYYDEEGRVKESITQNHVGGSDRMVMNYNFQGLLISKTRSHYGYGQGLSVTNNYKYDHMGRVLENWQQTGSADSVLLSNQEYNEAGQLWKKHLHATSNGLGAPPQNITLGAGDALSAGQQRAVTASQSVVLSPGFFAAQGSQFKASISSSAFLQDINYVYNERGWLLEQNAGYYSQQLHYNATAHGAQPQWNGNIAEQDYQAQYTGNQYVTYSYDELNRLTAGNSSAGFSETDIAYDNLGNIQSLNRSGTGTLGYSYEGNQLKNVSGLTLNGVYEYDANGNLKRDARNGGTTVEYNLLNLPRNIPGKAMSYSYDAAGAKLKRTVNGTLTDYVGGIQYENGQLQFVQTDEGRVLKSGSNWNYEYTLTDHLGNNRVTFDAASGKVGEEDYYPFGLNIHRQSRTANSKYLYNKKELQEELSQYDYGARFYDPVTARWTRIDNKAEAFEAVSPYAYAVNDPVNAVDPDGNLIIFVNGFVPGQWLNKNLHETIPVYDRPFHPKYVPNPDYKPYPGDRNLASGAPHYLGKAFDYWGKVDDAFMGKSGYNDNNALYINASSDNTSEAQDRYAEGQAAGQSLINQLDNGSISLKEGETIKIVGHSQGGAFSAGMASVISKSKKYASVLQEVVYLEPHQPADFNHPSNVKGVQISAPTDRVASRWNFLKAWKGKTSYSVIKGVRTFISNDTHDDDNGPFGLWGHSVGTNLDEIASYFKSLGVPVTVK